MNLTISDMIRCDILVVGGGLAGMYAAIEADEHGRDVMLVSKAKTGDSGSSLVSMSVHRFAPQDDKLRNEFRDRFVASGAGMQDMSLVDIFIKEGADAVMHTKDYIPSLTYRYEDISGRTIPYLCCANPKYGRYMTEPLRKYIEDNTDIDIKDGIMIFDIIIEDGRAIGALGLYKDKIILYKANKIILATGGCGNVYKYTSNTNDLTGDGYGIALRSGMKLIGMEFIQFYPYRIVSPVSQCIFPDIFAHGARYINEDGKRFMEDYPLKEQENRDIVAREIYRQDKVILDLSYADIEYLKKEAPELLDIQKNHPDKQLLVKPVAHFVMGGIHTDVDGKTDITNVYACGEIVGGLHGANRLSGSALVEAAVFARRAGKAAAAGNDMKEDIDDDKCIKAAQNILDNLYDQSSDIDMIDIEIVRDLMWQYAAVERTTEGLSILNDKLKDIKMKFDRSRPAKSNLKRWLEARDMIDTALAIARAAYDRKESIGAHYLNEKNKQKSFAKMCKIEKLLEII